MNNKIAIMIKTTKNALSVSAWLFIVSMAINEINRGGETMLEKYGFTKMALGVLAIGLGYGLPGFVYGCESLSLNMKRLIQMGIGSLVVLVTGFLVGWFPKDQGLKTVLWFVVSIGMGFAIWALQYFLYKKKQDRQMNERIRQMQE